MSSFLSPPSTTDLLIPRKQSNAKKTAAVAAAAAVVVFCPSGSARLPPPRSIPNEHTYLLSGWPETPSPVGTPEIEINPFAFQSDRLDTHLPLDSGSDTPAWSDASTHSTTSSSASTVSLDDRRGTSRRRSLRPLVKRASSDYDQSMSFPQAFDTSLGTRFESSTCGPVIERMVSDPGLQACHPFSLLLTTSNGFFHSLRGSPGALPLNDVLGTACTTDRDACGALADLMASRLTASDACGLELDKHNALAIEALQGLQNFRLMRDVGCLTLQDPILDLNTTHLNISTSDHQPTKASPNTSARRPSGLPNSTDPMGANTSSYLPTRPTGPTSLNYCFQAAANSTNPDDLYYYYLPTGTGLPSGTQPNCNSCTQTLMRLYSAAAANLSLPIHETYAAARTVTNARCGPDFAPVPVSISRAAASVKLSITALVIALLLSLWL